MKDLWPATEMRQVAQEIMDWLAPSVKRICVAGSLRRGQALVGDIELLYVPLRQKEKVEGELFAVGMVDQAEKAILNLQHHRLLMPRLSVTGVRTMGPKNKLMLHVKSGAPVDLFAAVDSTWANNLVMRTGPQELNVKICEAAKAKGWMWNPTGVGFTNNHSHDIHPVQTEQDVFSFVGLPYQEPEAR
jgi:DNA polymerase/3'-5' exonuclease PolX